jgi:cytochrome b
MQHEVIRSPTPNGDATRERAGTIRVWDPLVRLGHWALVATFTVAYVSGEEWEALHANAGYVVLGIVLWRILWGFIGSPHARFRDFVRLWPAVRGHLAALARLDPPRYRGHNPAGGWMVVLLLVMLVVTAVSGVGAYGAEGHGPLAGLVAGGPGWLHEALEETHEVAANLMVLLVVVHVAGVVVESWLTRENLVRAMVTGRK